MKKFFALLVTVAMLLVAGSAMAADPTLTLSSTTASVQAGTSIPETVTATATAGNRGGTLGAITVSGADWATVSGNTITLAPDASVTAGSYPITVSVVETYTDGAAGHSSIKTATATATLNVTVTAAQAGTTIIVKIVEVVTEVTKTVTVVSPVAQRAAVVQTFTETIRTVAQTVTVEVLTKVDGYDTALATVWQAKSVEVERKTTASVNLIATNPAVKERAFPGLPATAVVTPKPNTALVAATSTVTTTMTTTQKLAVMTDALGGAGKALSAQEAVKATESGTYSFNKTFGKALYGTKIKGHKGQRSRVTGSASFSASAVDNEGVAFVNSSGDIVDTIPDDSRSNDIMPGFVTMLVVMDAGEVYEPVVYATETDLKAAGVSLDTTPTTVTYNEITEEEKSVVVTVDEHGNVTETVVETVSADVVNKMASAMGVSSINVVPVSACADVPEATIKTDDAAAAADSVHVAARTVAFNDLPNGAYYFPITFQSLGIGVTVSGDFEFYPDGYSASTTAFAMIFDEKGNEITDPASVLAATSSNVKGYIAFEIENGGIKVADANNTLANPTVGILVKAVTPTPTPTSDDAVLNDLVTKGYVRGTTITDAGFAEKVTFSGTVYTGTVKLNFPVQPSSWTVSVAGNGSIKASAIGAITNATSTQATITLNKAEITAGTHAVTLSVLPTNAAGTAAAKTPVTASLGSVVGNPGLVGVGSSSGGCSAGSAVLALALLGVFIARKK